MKKEKNFLEKVISALFSFFSGRIAMEAAPDVLSTIGERLDVGADRLAMSVDRLGVNSPSNEMSTTKATSLNNEVTRAPRVRIKPLEKLTSAPNPSSNKDMGNEFMPAFKKPGEL